MQHATVGTETKWQKPRLPLPARNTKLFGVLSVLIGIAIVTTFVLVWTAPAINFNTLFNNSPVPPGNELGSSAADRDNNLSIFERDTTSLAESNSPEAYSILLQSLKQTYPPSQRNFILTALKDAPPAIVPVLLAGLNDSDAGVRAGAAQALGLRRESPAIAALTKATRDPDVTVRQAAITALGSLGAWEVLPRLEQLSVVETDYAIRQTALAAKESFKQEIAQAIGVPATELRDVSVTTGEVPQIYAVTTSNLYALHGTAAWILASRLPDAPLAIATGADPTLIYLATASSGLYRSVDSGETWEYVQFGSRTNTQLTVTAMVVDPQNARQAYIALAAPGTKPGTQDPMGIFVTQDGGATWTFLEGSPASLVTTRLVVDPQERGYLFGTDSDTPWRYALPETSQ